MDSLRRKIADHFSASSSQNTEEQSAAGSFSESTLRKYWIPDNIAEECYDCGIRFNTFRRRHHCRICGQIFCSKCTIFIPGKYLRVSGSLRVCHKCHRFVQDNLQNGQFGPSLDDLYSSEKGGESSASSAVIPGSSESGVLSEEQLTTTQRFSHLSIKSGSESNLSSSYVHPRSPLRSDGRSSRKSSYAGIGLASPAGHKTFMSESCDNINETGSATANNSSTPTTSLADFQRLLIIWHKLTSISPLPTGSHKFKMKVYSETFLGEELIAWLYEQEGLTVRSQAVTIAQALLDGELIADVTNIFQDDLGIIGQPRFHGSIPYKLKERKRFFSYNEELNENDEDERNEEDYQVRLSSQNKDDLPPEWLQDMEYASKSEQLIQVSKVIHRSTDDQTMTMSSPVEHKDLDLYFKEHGDTHDGEKNVSEIPCPLLDDVYKRHQSTYLQKLLSVEGLEQNFWADFILYYCNKVLDLLDMQASMRTTQIDVRSKVKIKCISNGALSDSAIIVGEVFTNKVIRSDMPLSLSQAKILLVKEAISFHRTDKFVSIANLHLVEEESIKNICNKIKALQPDLILVGENVCRLAQDILVQAGICVVQNVKEKNLGRIAGFFKTELVTSIASMVNIPQLGICHNYYSMFYEHQDKNLIFLEASPMGAAAVEPSQEGCCILLRGASISQLTKVKRVMKQFLVVLTHAKYEKAFLLDESAQVENFILPDYKSNHISTLSLSPFLDLQLPEDSIIEAIDAESNGTGGSADKNDVDNDQNMMPKSKQRDNPEVPLIITTNIAKDTKLKNRLADARASSTRHRSSSYWQTKKYSVQSQSQKAVPKIYDVLNKPVPMCFSSYLSNADGGSKYCIKPWVTTMNLYHFTTDVPLAEFLLSYCFDKQYKCRSAQDGLASAASSGIASSASSSLIQTKSGFCPVAMSDHGRRFCLGNSSVTLVIQKLATSLTREEDEDKIVMWKFCPECQTMTDLIPLSSRARQMSFAMFLLLLIFETKLLRRNVIKCCHSLHNVQYTCFGRHDQVAFFKLQRILPHMIRLPPPKVTLNHYIPTEKDLSEELTKISINGTRFFGQLNEKLVQLQSEHSPSSLLQSTLTHMSSDYSQEFDAFRQEISAIQECLNREGVKDMINIQSDILTLNISVMKSVTAWKSHLSKYFDLKKKEDKSMLKAALPSKSRIASGSTTNAGTIVVENEAMQSYQQLQQQQQQPQSLPILPSTERMALTEQELGTLTNPFSCSIHPDLYLKPNILIDENQPSTIIAYALGSKEHTELLIGQTTVAGNAGSRLNNADKKHLDCTFGSDCGSSKFFVRVQYPSEFHHFRKQIFDEGCDHQDFLASLAKCDPWQSSGGKSGATFYKTSDGRFFLKQINKHEMESFQAIAYRYFTYMTTAEQKSLMARIVGVYTVGFKTPNGGTKLNLVIIENLFHGHKIEESFDLKGSMRNRLVDLTKGMMQSKGKELVLMDENFLRIACERPFYVRDKVKADLMAAIARDAKFLCDIKVMDYSLLVGKDVITNELVVGIIDYLRPFSIDKMIESQMKKTSGYFQGTAEDPTVISPQAYQSRFISAMDNYFILLPGFWYDGNNNMPMNSE